MNINELEKYAPAIAEKINILIRKLKLSSLNAKDSGKLESIGKDLLTLKDIKNKLENQTLQWNDLEFIGISQDSLDKFQNINIKLEQNEFQDFELLNQIPMLTLIEKDGFSFINQLYSIIDYINTNYQMIFTQKLLQMSDKTNSRREQFYLQYQDIIRSFKNYSEFIGKKNEFNTNKPNFIQEQFLIKEYQTIVKKIFLFLSSIKTYIEKLLSDDTFSQEDWQSKITCDNTDVSIYGLPLSLALEECFLFVKEALKYISAKEKDLIDSIILIEQKNNK
ncbi:MAG: hypothetical protein ACRCTQ_00435 [Brevinemataceae bacterium]